MATIMDDQEFLKLKKPSGKKKRSLSNFSSVSSIVRDNYELNQLLDAENTMVYALVEVSKDSKKCTKTERIPLNNKDFFLMMQKFMNLNSKKEKRGRKILKASLKRKLDAEAAESITKLLKYEKNYQYNELKNQIALFSDEANVLYEHSNHSPNEIREKKDKYNTNHGTPAAADETQVHHRNDLKVLYNRNTAPGMKEPKIGCERNDLISRGTNTDIVQTPKVLEGVMEALNLNLGLVNNEKKTEKSSLGNSGESRRPQPNTHHFFNIHDEGSHDQSAQPNFLLVPFFITNKSAEIWKKSHSCNTASCQRKCIYCSQLIEYDFQSPEDMKVVKSFTDLRQDINPINISLNTIQGFHMDCMVKNEMFFGKEKEAIAKEKLESNEQQRGFLEEVKMLQMKLNAIIKHLETKNLMACHDNSTLRRGKEEDCILDEAYCRRGVDFCQQPTDSFRHQCNSENCNNTSFLLYRYPSHNHQETLRSQDFCVQAMLQKSSYDRTVSMHSSKESDVFTTKKKTLLEKLSQFPSEMKIEKPLKREKQKIPTSSKSSPNFQTNTEHRFVNVRRTSSSACYSKVVRTMDFSHLANLNLKCEGLRPDNGDQFGEKELKGPRELKEEKHKEEAVTPEKSTNIIFKKEGPVSESENDNDRIVTLRQYGKIAKIKVVGNANLRRESQGGGIGQIKLQIDDNKSIKISNRFTAKARSNSSDTTNPSDNSNSNNNIRTNIGIDCGSVKDVENKKMNADLKTEGQSITAKREHFKKKQDRPEEGNRKVQAKTTDSPLDHSQSTPKSSKLKKPTIPVRLIGKGKESTSGNSKALKGELAKSQLQPTRVEECRTGSQPLKKVKCVEKIQEENPKAGLPEKKMPNASQTPANEAMKVPSVDSARNVISKSTAEKIVEGISDVVTEQSNEKQSEAVKSIWALTKVILYKDGSQSFQVLEASSSPPGYHLTKKKEHSDSNGEPHSLNRAEAINITNNVKN